MLVAVAFLVPSALPGWFSLVHLQWPDTNADASEIAGADREKSDTSRRLRTREGFVPARGVENHSATKTGHGEGHGTDRDGDDPQQAPDHENQPPQYDSRLGAGVAVLVERSSQSSIVGAASPVLEWRRDAWSGFGNRFEIRAAADASPRVRPFPICDPNHPIHGPPGKARFRLV